MTRHWPRISAASETAQEEVSTMMDDDTMRRHFQLEKFGPPFSMTARNHSDRMLAA
jgi:hypothetical protein